MIKEYFKHIEAIFKVPILRIIIALGGVFNLLFLILKIAGYVEGGYLEYKNMFYNVADFLWLMICVLVITFIVGLDDSNKMGDISTVISNSRSNLYILRKLAIFFIIYIPIYLITSLNILGSINEAGYMSIKNLFIYSLITQIFVISFTLFLISYTRNIPTTIIIITSVYFIQEFLWRSKITRQYGVLAHRYLFDIGDDLFKLKVKLFYFGISIISLIASYYLIGRKKHR